MAASLRRTLAVRFSLTMAVALLAIALWSYLGMRNTLREQLDRSLHTSYELQALALGRDGRLPTLPAGLEDARFIREINRLVVGRDSAGRVLQSNREVAADFALDTGAFRAALAGRLTSADGAWKGHALRSLYGPAPAGASDVVVLQVAASLDPLESASRGVLLRMLATALLGSLASLVGAAWLARSALLPVHDIAAQARAIQGDRSGQRITVHADVAELRGLIEVLNRMLERLDRSSEWHRRIIRDLGHDLRTPITTLRATVETALMSERSAERYRAVLAGLMEEIDRLELIGDAMSILARLESGELAPRLVVSDLGAVAGQAVERARERDPGHDLRFVPPATALTADADPRLLGMTLDQLLDNVQRHTPAGTRADVTGDSGDGVVRLTVEDRGPGVPEEKLRHLFDRFYRGDPARGRAAGAGLGLTLAAAIVDLHGGRIIAERGDAGGLRVRIELPAGDAPSPGRAGDPATSAPSPGARPASRPPTGPHPPARPARPDPEQRPPGPPAA